MVPFTIHQLKLFVQAEINDRLVLAYLDTGTPRTLLSPDGARRFLSGPQSSAPNAAVALGSVRFLEMEFRDVPATVAELEHLSEIPFDAPLALGAQVLLSMPLILDFKRHQIGFADQPLRRELAVIPAEFHRGLTMIPFTLNGRELRGIIDTGSGYSVINAARAPQLLGRSELSFELEVAGADEKMKVYRSPDLVAGDVSLGDCEYLLMDLSDAERGLGTQIDFILGVNTLITSGRVWVLNFAGRNVRIVRNGIEVMGNAGSDIIV